MQDIWRTTVKWDDKLLPEQLERWLQIKSDLRDIPNIKIPRHVGLTGKEQLEIHGFSDASAKAYGCCIYLRCISTNNISCNLILAKSRVSPIKPMSIPRMELKAAHLLADMVEKVKDSWPSDISQWGWIDSKVALCWIESPPERWKPFLRNRVHQIQELNRDMTWRYVATKENPADLVSRGCNMESFRRDELWFHGPGWLNNVSSMEHGESQLDEEQQIMCEEEQATVRSHTECAFHF